MNPGVCLTFHNKLLRRLLVDLNTRRSHRVRGGSVTLLTRRGRMTSGGLREGSFLHSGPSVPDYAPTYRRPTLFLGYENLSFEISLLVVYTCVPPAKMEPDVVVSTD